MAWAIEYTVEARRSLKRIDRKMAKRIMDYMELHIARLDNPRQLGQALSGALSGAWRYRVGDYRVLCKIQDAKICVLVSDVGHRGEVYRK